MTPKTYGFIYRHSNGQFVLGVDPHVRARLKRLFIHCKQKKAELTIPDTAAACQDLEMVLNRWPLSSPDGSLAYVRQRAAGAREQLADMDQILAGEGVGEVDLLLPLRPYQAIGVELWKRGGRLLCGDSLGLGKTCVGIGGWASGLGPMIVVCQNHLTYQWRDQFHKFVGDRARIHIQAKGSGELKPHDVLVLPYTMLAKWADRLEGYTALVFDEVQELRRDGTEKYKAAKGLAGRTEHVLGLSATPVINYGDEIYNVLDLINPDCLGPRSEFLSEWCSYRGNHFMVSDPVALGTFIAENHLFLRRTRHDVGKQMPPVNRVVIDVPFDAERLSRLNAQSLQLAQAILAADSSFHEKGLAARQLDLVLRQQTGIMKAPAAADAVVDLVRSGERVLVTAWHREVYSILTQAFTQAEIPHWKYTGTETPQQKDAAAKAFLASKIPGVLMMSIGSGAGLDGLQEKCSTIVHVELPWSRKISDQATGRLARDGQDSEVTEVFMVASGGSDPIISAILGLKEEQANGIVDPLATAEIETDEVTESRGTLLARLILASVHRPSLCP